MNIKFLVNPVFGGWSPLDTRLGGTEESVVEWASRIAARGHTVTVYHNQSQPLMEHRGVSYQPRENYYGGDGITINIKSSDIAPQEPTWYLTNETNAKDLDLSQYVGVIVPSKWAFDYLGIQHPNLRILPHGYDPMKIYAEKKIPNQCLYASSPDRGLYDLLNMWPAVVRQVPDATLLVTYGGLIDAPGVMCLGDVDDEWMSELFRTSEYWVHPCNGGELFCMSGIKAQVSRTIPVYYPVMALQETVRWGVRTKPETFVRKLVDIMTNPKKKREILNHSVHEYYQDWDDTTTTLLQIIGARWL